MKLNNMFVVFEGPDGSGKTTAIRAVADAFRERGVTVLCTREPGGSEAAEAMRNLLMQDTMRDAPVLSQLLLICAARVAHLRQSIEPALARGELVLCDRYVDSSYVYQCEIGQLPSTTLDELNRVLAIRHPDLRLFFDLPPEVAMTRIAQRAEGNRFDADDHAAWMRVARAYQQRCQVGKGYAVTIDASADKNTVVEQCLAVVDNQIGRNGSLMQECP